MSEATKDKKEISQKVVELAAKIQEAMKIEADGSCKLESDTFYSTLPEGMKVEDYKAAVSHRNTYVQASTLAVGQLAVKAMAKDNKLDTVVLTSHVGSDKHEVVVSRSKTIVNRLNGGEETVRKGHVVSAFYATGASKSSAELKRIRNEVTELAMKAF